MRAILRAKITFAMNAVFPHTARNRSGQRRVGQAAPLPRQRWDPINHRANLDSVPIPGQDVRPQLGARLARPLVRHYAGRRGGARGSLWLAPPLRAAGSGLTGITGRASCSRACASSDGWQDFGCWLEKRLKSDTDDPQ
jgi:hypothetical protein